MNIFSKLAILVVAPAVVIPAPTFASEVAQEHMMCPLEAIAKEGDRLEFWRKEIVINNGDPTNDLVMSLNIQAYLCAETNQWSKSDQNLVYELNMAILSAVAMAEKLTSLGLDPEKYESVLEKLSPADLQKILDDPNNSPALKQSLVLLIKDLGSKATVEIAADVRKYLSNAARSRLFAQELMPSSK